MATAPPAAPPDEPGEPPNRWPWFALGLALLVIVVVALFYLLNRPRAADVSAAPTATATPVVVVVTATPLPTLTASPTPAPSATPVASPTPPPPTATPAAAPTAPTTVPAAQAEPTSPPPAQAAPPVAQTGATPTTATVAASPTPSTQAAAPAATVPPTSPTPPTPSPTPFAGQVANAGGLGNTRSDYDTTYGAPAGETPDHLVVYRKASAEYHVQFVPDPQGRAALVVELPQQGQQPWSLDQAVAEARKLLPKDAQPPSPPQEGNDQFVVERYTSQSLALALPAAAFTANKGQPGQFLVVYVRDPQQQGRISRIIVGTGSDPQVLIQQGR